MKDISNRRFEENLSVLKLNYPPLFERVINKKDKIKIIYAKNGLPTFKYRGIYIESKISPGSIDYSSISFNKRFDKNLKNNRDNGFIFLGSGLSYHINQLLDKMKNNAILIEKEIDIFIASLFVLKPSILKNLILIIDKDYFQTVEIIKNLEFGCARLIKHPFSTKLNKDYYDNIERYIKERFKEDVASHITTEAQKELWKKNVLRNIINIKGDRFFTTKSLAGKFSGPVILVASGPSVDNIVMQLKRIRNYIPIVALLPSLKLLNYNGIRPDALFTTDPGYWNKERFTISAGIPLFTTFSVNHLITENWQGRIFYFNHGLDIELEFNEIVKETLTIPMQGTSSIVMILFARLLGFNPLYLAGFDFCEVGLKDHHLGAGFDSYFILKSSREFSWYTGIVDRAKKEGLKRVDGFRNIYTTYKLMLYKRWLEKWIVGDDLLNISEIWPINGIRKIGSDIFEREIVRYKSTSQNRLGVVLLNERIPSIIENYDLKERLESIINRAKRKLIEDKHISK